jgi:hypothetical protein
MGSILIVAPLAVAVIGFLFFIGGAGHLFRGSVARGGLGLGAGGAVTIAGLAAGLIGLNIQSYSRLTYEVPVAEVSVRLMNPAEKTFSVAVKRLDGSNAVTACTLQGDAWEISGRFQKWKPWANEIGLNATYTLDQISNKYYSAREANGRSITACDLNGPPPAANHLLPESWVKWLMAHVIVQDRFFGSANYMPMVDGAEYRVITTQFGFNAEPANEAAQRANQARAF